MAKRDYQDHFRFSPLQTQLAHDVCQEYGVPMDLSTSYLIDESGIYDKSTGILRLLLSLGTLYVVLGWVALCCIPRIVRDGAYGIFAKNRGRIWRQVKQVTGMGDMNMDEYRNIVLGLEDKVETNQPSWGFTSASSKSLEKEEDEKSL